MATSPLSSVSKYCILICNAEIGNETSACTWRILLSFFYYGTPWIPLVHHGFLRALKHFPAPRSELSVPPFLSPWTAIPLHGQVWGAHAPWQQRPYRYLTWKMAWRNQSHLSAYMVKLTRPMKIIWGTLSALCSQRQNYKHIRVCLCSSEGKLLRLYVTHFLFLFISCVLACTEKPDFLPVTRLCNCLQSTNSS